MKIQRGKNSRPSRMVFYGPEGIGKTTLASQFPKPLFIDLERGTNQIDLARFEDSAKTWQELIAQVKYVIDNPTICKTLVIDTADAAEILCIDYICKMSNKESLGDFGYGTGYQHLAEEFDRFLKLLNKVTDMGINVIVLGHSWLRKQELPDEMGAFDRYELKLQKKDAPLLKEWCDTLLFLNYKTNVVDHNGSKKAIGGERVIYTNHKPTYDAKNRFGLPEEIPMEYDKIKHLAYDNFESTIKEKEERQDFSLLDGNPPEKIDEDFTLINEDDAGDEYLEEITGFDATVQEIIARASKENIFEKDIVKFMLSKNIKPTEDEIPDLSKIRLRDYDGTFLQVQVLEHWDNFMKGIKKFKKG